MVDKGGETIDGVDINAFDNGGFVGGKPGDKDVFNTFFFGQKSQKKNTGGVTEGTVKRKLTVVKGRFRR